MNVSQRSYNIRDVPVNVIKEDEALFFTYVCIGRCGCRCKKDESVWTMGTGVHQFSWVEKTIRMPNMVGTGYRDALGNRSTRATMLFNNDKENLQIYNDILLLQCQIACHFKQAWRTQKNELVLEISVSRDMQIHFEGCPFPFRQILLGTKIK